MFGDLFIVPTPFDFKVLSEYKHTIFIVFYQNYFFLFEK